MKKRTGLFQVRVVLSLAFLAVAIVAVSLKFSAMADSDPSFTDLQNLINAVKEGGTLKLESNFTAVSGDSVLVISKNMTLDLNGHILDRGLGSTTDHIAGGDAIRVSDSATVVIKNSQADENNSYTDIPGDLHGGIITGANMYGNGGGIRVDGGATLTLDGVVVAQNRAQYGGGMLITGNSIVNIINGTIFYGNSSDYYAGAVQLLEGTLTIADSTFMNNSSARAGAIEVCTNMSCEITDSTFKGNKSVYAGNGIYNYGNLKIKNSDLIANVRTGGYYAYGGAIYNAASASCSIEGGHINENKLHYGAGVYNCGELTVTGVTAENNISEASGGALYAEGGSMVVSGAAITLNTAKNYGAGLFINSDMKGTVIFNGTTFSQNNANYGGALGAFKGTKADLTDCIFSENTSKSNGGAAYFGENTLINCNNCTFTKNKTTGNQGGAFYITTSGQLNLIGTTTISKNTSEKAGGAFMVESKAKVKSTGSISIKDNVSNLSAGAFYVTGSGTVELTDATITGNSAKNNGGAIVVDNGNVKLHGATISGNSASIVQDGIHKGGGINFVSGTLEMDGLMNITGNKVAGTECNLYLRSGATFKDAGLAKGSTIGVYAQQIESNELPYVALSSNETSLDYLSLDGITSKNARTFKLYKNPDTKVAAIIKLCNVSFAPDNGSTIQPQQIWYNELVTEPTQPVKTGYEFKGWFSDSEFANGWTFATSAVKDDMTLYCKWAEHVHGAYTFIAEGNKLIPVCHSAGTCQWENCKGVDLALILNAPEITTYGETDKSAEATVTGEIDGVETPAVEYYLNTEKLSAAPVDAGLYTAKITYAGATASLNYTIEKAQPVITVDTTPIVKTYGETVTLPVASADYGTVSCDKSAEDIVDAGSYTVTYSVAEGDNYSAASETVSVTINKLPVDEPTVTGTYIYNGEEQSAAVAGKETYMTEAGDVKGTNAGSYTITYTLDGNHSWATGSDGSVTWSIGKLAVNEPQVTGSYIFNENEQSAVVTGKETYMTEAGDVKGTNVGSYTITYTLDGNHSWADGSDGTITWTIEKADTVITVDKTPIIIKYGESITLPTATSNYGTVTCDKTAADLIDAGSYTVTYSVADNGNYSEASETVSVTINKLPVDEPTVTGTYIYNGEEQSAVVSGREAYMTEAGDVKGKDAGSYTITYTLDGNHSWAAGSDGTVTWSIGKAAQQAPSAPAEADKTDASVTLAVQVGRSATVYGYSTTDTVPENWQDSATVTGLEGNTTYYFFTKFVEDSNYYEAVSEGTAITTDNTAHIDENNDHFCDLCNEKISEHIDADNDHYCDICNECLSYHADSNSDHLCDLCKITMSGHYDADNHYCDICGIRMSEHIDSDNDMVCDICGYIYPGKEDKDSTGKKDGESGKSGKVEENVITLDKDDTISADTVNELIESLAESGEKELVISTVEKSVKEQDKADGTVNESEELNLGSDVIAALVEAEGIEKLAIQTDVADIELSASNLKSLKKQADGDVSISITRTEQTLGGQQEDSNSEGSQSGTTQSGNAQSGTTQSEEGTMVSYKFNITDEAGNEITSLGKKTVKITVPVPENLQEESPVCIMPDGNGGYTTVKATVNKNGTMTIETKKLDEIFIMSQEEAEKTIGGKSEETSQKDDSEKTDESDGYEKYTIPVKGDDVVQVGALINDGNADVEEITQSDIDKILEKGSQKNVIIDLSGAKSEVDSVTITKKSLETLLKGTDIKDSTISGLEIKLSKASVNIDAAALEAIYGQVNGDEFRLVVSDNYMDRLNAAQLDALKDDNTVEVLDVHIECNGVEIHDFKGGKIEVMVEFNIESGRDARHYFITYVSEDGLKEVFPTRYENGNLIFITDHFSDYVILYDENLVNDTGKPSTSDGAAASKQKTPYLKMTKIVGLGNKFTFNVTNIDADAKIKYTSSNKKIATVDKKGVITAVGIGKCTIKGVIKQNGTTYKFALAVKVKDTGRKNRQVKKSELLTPDTDTPLLNVFKAVKTNKSVSLSLKGLEKDAIVAWKSEDESVATVSENGTVTGIKNGYTGIDAYVEQNGKTYQFRVFVGVGSEK